MPRAQNTAKPRTKEEVRSTARAIRKAMLEAFGARVCVTHHRTCPAGAESDALHLATSDPKALARKLVRRGSPPRALIVHELGLFTLGEPTAPGELSGHVAVVTGAGSGLGRSIAIGLAGAGARVALVDVDLAAARETAARIAQQALPVRCDVTRPTDVDRACGAVLDRWGGLDILVNAAGIAPAYPLVDLPVEKWRQALEVNLTGYFLMAQAAARIMIRQGMGGSIIALSSKSGLEASRDNSAYNATKAGEIHLARGWALELGEHGIRVNAVAPGNVFAGSGIWNPEYIRACARKYGLEPEEVIPYYINKTALKQEISGPDVAEAVVFLCSPRAAKITGQTLVVDAGQVMVR